MENIKEMLRDMEERNKKSNKYIITIFRWGDKKIPPPQKSLKIFRIGKIQES